MRARMKIVTIALLICVVNVSSQEQQQQGEEGALRVDNRPRPTTTVETTTTTPDFELKPRPPEKPGKPRKKKKNKKMRSTSSSSGERKASTEEDDRDSLEASDSGQASNTEGVVVNKKKYMPQSTEERHGWMKWHRKCGKCPEDMKMKWRDPRIKWVCGAYQRARRSFKSRCMMRLRNCQDGTMFVPIHEHRCTNSSAKDSKPHGEHFFYDYKVDLSGDTTKSNEESSESDESSEQQ